ncbi:hypothetical protein CFC21_047239, partial [Triticum aestivum]
VKKQGFHGKTRYV